MTDRLTEVSPRVAARVAGFGLLIISVLGIFSVVARDNLIEPGDAAATASNIGASEGLFRWSIVAFIVVLILDVVIAWALFVLLKPVDKNLSLLAAWFRLAYAAITAAVLYQLVSVLELLGGDDYLTAFDSSQLQALALQTLNGYDYGFLIGLAFFAVHLLVLGYLVFKSGYIPRIFGVLLVVASFGYVLDTFANILLSSYADYETIFTVIVSVPGFIAEVALMLWLLIKGRTIPELPT